MSDNTDKKVTVELTCESLSTWADEQYKAAMEESGEALKSRLDNFTHVVTTAKAHFEQSGATMPVQVEMLEAYVGSMPGAKKMDLTTSADQKVMKEQEKPEDNSAFLWPLDMAACVEKSDDCW
jgi:hypothetical protein